MKVNAAQSKFASIISVVLFSGLLVSIPVPANAAGCTSPTTTTVGTNTVVTFTTVESCDWTVPAGVVSVWAVAVGGGGASGAGVNNQWWGAGGGGGEVTSQTISVTAGNTVAVVVGAGGTTGNGSTSSFGSVTANGGKTPTNTTAVGGVSGSGMAGGSGTPGTTIGGGGGGAWKAAVGISAGEGLSSSISGTAVEYGGGGNGYNSVGTAGTPRPGAGSYATAAEPNRGGGGSIMSTGRGAGGSGVVIISYKTPIECSPSSTIVGSDTVLTFSASGTCFWQVPTGVTAARVLVVGGGGGGGSSLGGGGGGGQVVSQNSVSVSGTLTIKIGAGGIGGNGSYTSTTNNGKTGSSSSITGGALNISALGGSGGNGRMSATNLNPDGTAISSGYTGGGGAYENPPAQTAIAGSGGPNYIGGNGSLNGGGGGGGAGGPGVARGNGSTPSSNASSGGIGLSDSITGTSTYYGGGGGASWYGGPAAWTGAGGLGGGGQGANGNSGSADGGDGTANKGGGGGGGYDGTVGGDGGSGVVIVRYGQPAGTSVLTFDANSGTGSDAAVYLRTATSETLPSKTKITRPGFEFTGWNENANGSGTPYALGGTITISVNTTLYAQWSRNTSPSCAANVGKGGSQSTTLASTKAGNGCVGISYFASGVSRTETFNYTGSDQSWTVPAGVTSATFYLFGAGGGGNTRTSGGGGGYATGAYSVTAGHVYTVIVGEGGGAETAVTVAGLTGKYTKVTYGGGGRGGSTMGDTYIGTFASGGGRSAIRVQGATTDLATAAGGGGGGYGVCGFGGGGLSGVGERGGTQTAGGASASVSLSGTAGNGSAYRGGDSNNEGGGGGGGYYGGGDGGDNNGGGGGSSYIALLINGATSSGANCSGTLAETVGLGNVVTYNSNSATSGTAPNEAIVPVGKALTASANTGTLARTNYTFSGWNTAADGSGTSYAVGSTTFIPSGNTTLYAQWNSTITYNGNGQTSLDSTVPTPTTAKGSTNTTLAAPTTLTRTNFTFDGWNTAANGSGASYASGLTTYSSTGSLTLYAQWKAQITFSGNTNSGGTAPAIVNAITSTITLPSNSGNLIKTGYVFSGWNTAANGSGTTYATGATYTITGTTTLYAAWTPDNTGLTPSFNTNTSSPIGVLASASYVINTAYTNNANDLILSQYPDKIQIIATVPSGTLAITTTTNLTLPIGYQSALNTAAATISFVGNLTDVNAALASLKYTAAATAVNTTISISASYAGLNGDYRYNPDTGSSYIRNATTVVWADAYNPTTTSSNCGIKFNGMCGYMVVPNTVAESTFIGGMLGTGWIGVIKSSGLKYIDNAPSAIAGTTVTVTNWNTGEGATAGENNVGISVTTGKWADLSTQSYNAIYEFGGKSETPLFAPLTRTIEIGALVTPAAPTLATASDTGTSSTDKITKDNTPDINIGGLTSGATVTLTATPASGTAVTCTFLATSTTGTCTFPTMADGTYSITATQTLGGTTTAASTALANVVIDATRPTVSLSSSNIVSGGNLTATPGIPTVSATITVTFSESVSGLLISEITKNVESTGWAITTTAFTTAAISTINFVASNTTGAGGTAGIAKFSVAEGVASDVAGNTNTATISDFIINTLIQLTLSNEYQQSPLLNPVVGGSGGTIAQTSPGQAITMPGQLLLSRVGHTFAGWSLETTNGSGAVVGTTFTPTVPVKLYSSWTPNVYVVTYDANGGNGTPATTSQSFNYGGTALTPSAKGTLSKTGYTFAGWSTTQVASGTIYSNSSDAIAGTTTTYTPTGSIILYAKWSANTYAVTFNSNTGSGTQMTNMSIVAGTAKPLTTNSYTKVGFIFGGWNSLANGTGTNYANLASVTFYSDVTLYAQWTPVIPGAPTVSATTAGNTTATVTVTGVSASGTSTSGTAPAGSAGPASSYSIQTYASDGTTVITGKTCTVLASANPLSCEITGLTNGTTYKFKATAINTTGSTTGVISTVTAIPAPYVVTYALNGGTLATTTANYNLGTPVILPLPSKSGYTFAGWYAETGLTTFVGNDAAPYSPTAATTLYAKWAGVVYTITYNGNGSSGGTVPASGSYTNGGTAYPVVDNTGSLAKTGYTFAGWYTNATGTGGSAYAVASTYSSAANIILFAKWSPVARTVTYALNSGSGTTPTQLTGKFIGDTFSTSVATGFSRSGYSFTGWSDGTNIYAANSTYTVAGSDVVLTAQWAAVSYSVSFLSNGATSGSAPTQSNLTSGQTFNLPANPFSKTGYTFTGWNDGTNNYLENAVYTMTAANTVLVAQWTARGFSITYDGNTNDGGSAPAAGNFVTGSPAYSIALNSFTKTGHTFTGWHTTANGTGGTAYAPGAGYSTTADLVLYAQWAAKTISVVYNINGATGTVPTTASWTYNASSPITLPVVGDLVKAGYTFDGWATTASATSGITAASPVNDTTYYAVWTLSDLAVTYTAGAGTGNVAGTTAKMGTTFPLAASTGLVAPTPNGGCVSYTFATWGYNGATYKEGSSFVMGSAAIPFEAQWTCVFNVRYTLNGGSGVIADVQKANNDPIVIGAAPTRDGYTFANWVDQSGTSWAPGASTTVIDTRYLFFAVWTATPRTVTYSLNGGSGTEPTTLTGKTIGQIFSTATTLSTKAGYTFGGWNDGTRTYPAGSSYTIALADVVLTAVWNPATYSITYNGNGATSGATPSNGTFTTGGSYSIPANSVGNLAKTGFSFAGWSTTSNGGGTSYADAATTLTTTSDVILYAKWSAASYAVTYVLNGATSALPTQSAVQYGSTFTLAAAATQEGKNFIGWSDGTNTYGGGSTYTIGTAAVILTASWQDQVYAVTYALNGGTGSAPTQSGLANGGTFIVATTSSMKSGYTFDGWNNGTTAVTVGSTYTMTTNNVTLTAVWKIAVPGAPGSVTAVGGDGSAIITVTAPSTGGTPTSYVVTASPGPGTCTVISPATSCSISPLTNGTSYTFSATATNSTGTSSGTTSSAVTPAGKPDAPTGVNAVRGNGSATVSFIAPVDTGGPAISSYTVTASPGGATCTVNAPATSCIVQGLTNGTAYTFAVTANNGLFTSSASTASSSIVPATVPDAPTSITATSTTSGSATVAFTAPANNGGSAITGYTVTSSPAGGTCVVGANATTYTCTGLTDGTAYTFAVVAVNSVGNSVSGTSTSVTTQGAAAAPTTISATSGDGKATVTFSGAVSNGSTITGYTVQAYDNTGNAVTGITCTVTSSATSGSCEVTGLTNGSSYTFKAVTNSTANTASVSSVPSIPTSAIIPAKAPDAPTGVQVVAGTGKISVSWTEPASNGSAITSYAVQAYDSTGTTPIVGATCTATAPATTCDVSANLVAGTNYTFKVTATSAAGTSSASSASTSIAVNAAPSVPLSVVATAGNGTASVSWDPPANSNGAPISGYTVQAYDSNGNAVTGGTCTTTAAPCTVPGLTNGSAYTFKVSATNSIGTSLPSTASLAVTPSTVPNAPTAVSAAVGDAEATISFTAPANNGGSSVTGYTVTASNGATISGTSSPLTISGLTNGTAYTFTVKATNKNGNSVASTASTAVTPIASSIPTVANGAQPTGNPYVGSTLTSASTFNGAPTPTQTYQWKVCTSPTDLSTCTNISGATSASYVPTISDEGKYIVVDATATNRVGTLTETSNPTLVINPEIAFSAPSPVPGGTVGASYVLSTAAAGGVGAFSYTVSNGTLPAGVTLDPATGQVAGTPTTAGTYTFTVRATDSNGVYKDVVVTITIAAATAPAPAPTTPTTPVVTQPTAPTCDADCQAAKEAAATKAAADKAAADAIAKAAAEKAAADAAAAAKAAANTAATNASTKAAADAAAAAAAAKAAIDKAAAAAVAQAAADAAAKAAAAQAKAAADAQAIAAKAAADAAAALKNSTATAAAKAAATASANTAAAQAAAAVKAAATAAQQAATAKTTAANANKQVDIAINTLTSKTASSQASAQANAIAAAAKAAADEAAKAAADAASAAKATAAAAQKAASDTAARIATEQKQAADAAAQAKVAAAAAAKATADKIAAEAVATKAAQDLAKVLADKAALAEQAAKTTDETARADIQKKIEEVTTKVDEVQKSVDVATAKAETAAEVQQTATQTADTATKEAQTQAAEAVAVKAESVAKTAAATKAVAAATVAAKVATAAKAAAAKIPSKATITAKPSTTASKNSATATVTGLKPGQKVKVTVNVKDK